MNAIRYVRTAAPEAAPAIAKYQREFDDGREFVEK
jgi:hypothetical protein